MKYLNQDLIHALSSCQSETVHKSTWMSLKASLHADVIFPFRGKKDVTFCVERNSNVHVHHISKCALVVTTLTGQAHIVVQLQLD